jgi:hypothetical protein
MRIGDVLSASESASERVMNDQLVGSWLVLGA